MKTTILFAVLFASLSTTEAGIGMGVLMIWPSARSTALAGAMTGLADEADATYFNPAGLAFQTTTKADVNFGNWLPGLHQGLYYASAIGGAPVRLPFLRGHNAFIAGSLAYLTTGEVDIVTERGEFLARVDQWRGVAAVHTGVMIVDNLGAGINVKLAYANRGLANYEWPMWYGSWVLGFEPGGSTATIAFDAGLLYRPSRRFAMGAMVANVGPKVSFRTGGWENDGYSVDLPRAARLGACWTPVETRCVRLRVMPQLDKVLVGMFSDTTGKSFGRQLHEEWHDVWKAIGIEATAFNIVSLRLGYFEDLSYHRGGIILEKEGQTYHYGVWDVLTRKRLGKFERIGLCWGIGLGTDKLRFDLSSDAAIYDFPTSNWKVQLVSNDIGGLFRRRS